VIFTSGAGGVIARLGANSIGSAASLAAIGMPVTLPLDKGAIASACHWRCWSLEIPAGRGKDAQVTPLHSKASIPALFQPGRGHDGASARRSGCA
jgi:hypothetical protein